MPMVSVSVSRREEAESWQPDSHTTGIPQHASVDAARDAARDRTDALAAVVHITAKRAEC